MMQRQHNMPRGFTLIEMIVVISIIVVVAGISYPTFKALTANSGRAAGINTVAIAIDAARGLGEKRSSAGTFVRSSWPDTSYLGSQPGIYSGAAALFTPVGEIRLIENAAAAVGPDRNSGDILPLEHMPTESADIYNGYRDIPGIDYISLPSGAGVLGIYRDPNTGTTRYLHPPFAVRFDQYGKLQACGVDTNAGTEWNFVYYNSNYDRFGSSDLPLYITDPGAAGFGRNNPYGGGAYNPADWSRSPDIFIEEKDGYTVNKHQLPFESIEAVLGVIVYDKAAYEGAGFGPLNIDDTDAKDWLEENGRFLYVSRYSGTVIREKTP